MSDKKQTYILLDGSKTTYGFSVNVDGIDTSHFERNPVMLYNHDSKMLPIGNWSGLRRENGQLLAEADFDENDTDDHVRRIIGKAKRGIIKMCSVGLCDIEVGQINGETVITKSVLREVSITPFGANRNAMRLYDSTGAIVELSDEIKLSDIFNYTKNKKMDKELNKLLNLSDDASPETIIASVKKLLEKQAELSDKVVKMELADKQAKRAKFDADLDAAVKSGSLDASAKSNFAELYEADSDKTINLLAQFRTKKSVSEQMEDARKSETGKVANLSDKSWDELDRSNKLVELREKAPDLYREKFKEKFGNYPM